MGHPHHPSSFVTRHNGTTIPVGIGSDQSIGIVIQADGVVLTIYVPKQICNARCIFWSEKVYDNGMPVSGLDGAVLLFHAKDFQSRFPDFGNCIFSLNV